MRSGMSPHGVQKRAIATIILLNWFLTHTCCIIKCVSMIYTPLIFQSDPDGVHALCRIYLTLWHRLNTIFGTPNLMSHQQMGTKKHYFLNNWTRVVKVDILALFMVTLVYVIILLTFYRVCSSTGLIRGCIALLIHQLTGNKVYWRYYLDKC